MRISAINAYNYTQKINLKNQINFGDYTSCGGDLRPWLKGDKYDLVIYRPGRNMFNATNRSKNGKHSRFLLNPQEPKYNKLVIMMKPGSKISTKSGITFFITTQKDDEKSMLGFENVYTSKEELKVASRLFSSLNPSKKIKQNPKPYEDKDGNVTYDSKTRKMLRSFLEDNNLEMKDAIAYMTD